MKKVLLCLMTLAALSILTGCKKNTFINNAIAIATDESGTFLINAQQQRYYLNDYDEIVGDFGDIIIVRKNDQYGYISKDGHELIRPQYQFAYPFSEDLAVVKADGRYLIINPNNEIQYVMGEGITSDSYFSEGFLVVSKTTVTGGEPETRYGYLNENYQMVTAYLFDVAFPFSEGRAAVGKIRANGLAYAYIKTDGEYLIQGSDDDRFSFTYASFFQNGYAKVSDNAEHKFGFINEFQDFVIPCIYDYAQDGFNRFFLVANNTGGLGKVYQFLDNNQNPKCVFSDALNRLGILENDIVPVDLNNGSYGIYQLIQNENYIPGSMVSDEKYPWTLSNIKIVSENYSIQKPMGINDFRNGIASFYTIDRKYGLVNDKGAVLLEPVYTKIIY